MQPGTPSSPHRQLLQPSSHSSPTSLLSPFLSLHCPALAGAPKPKLQSLSVQAASPFPVHRQVLHSTCQTSPTALTPPSLSRHCEVVALLITSSLHSTVPSPWQVQMPPPKTHPQHGSPPPHPGIAPQVPL